MAAPAHSLIAALAAKLSPAGGSDATARFLRRGASASVLLKVSATGLSFLTGVFLARVLGPENFGIYAYAMALATLLAVPAALGLPQLLIREVAASKQRADWGLMRGLLQWSDGVTVAATVLLMALGAPAAWFLSRTMPEPGLAALGLALLLVPFMALASLRVAALQGLRHVVLAQLPDGLLRPALFLVGTLLAWLLLGSTFGVLWALAIQLVVTILAFAAGVVLLAAKRPEPLAAVAPRRRAAAWRASMAPMLFISGVYIINAHADLLMLGLLASAHDVGVYRVATRGSQIMLFMLIAANVAAAPVFASLAGDRPRLQAAVTLTARIVLLFSLPMALLLVLFGEPLLRLVFGGAYAGAAAALAILAVGQLVNAATGSAAELLMMTGNERANAKVAALGVVANVGGNAVLIPAYGMEGAAVATAVSVALVNILLTVAARRKLRVDATALGWAPAG